MQSVFGPSGVSTSPALETQRLRLRPLTLDDALAVHALASRWEIADTTLSIPHPLSLEQTREWIAQRLARTPGGQALSLAIVPKPEDLLVGVIGLRLDDTEHARAEVGFWVGVGWWNRGYATEAAQAMIGFGFGGLGLHRIYAYHLARNPASGRVMAKAGMQREGLLRQAVCKWGEFEDVVLWAILWADWLAQAVARVRSLAPSTSTSR